MKKSEVFRTIKFVLFSISAGVIQIVSFAFFYDVLHWAEWLAYLVALILSVLWNFTFNRRYTFRSDGNVARAMLLVALFYCVFTPLSTGLEHVLAGMWGWNAYLVTIINMTLNLITEFLYQRFVVYRNSMDTNALAKDNK